jgi:hypothetical protein
VTINNFHNLDDDSYSRYARQYCDNDDDFPLTAASLRARALHSRYNDHNSLGKPRRLGRPHSTPWRCVRQ